MKIALTYFLAGSGHFREAYSIAKELQKTGYETNLIGIENRLELSHKISAKICLWYFLWQMSLFLLFGEQSTVEDLDKKMSSKSRFAELLVFWSRKLEYLLGSFIKEDLGLDGYDAIISTHPMASVLAVGAGLPRVINICPDEVGEVTSSFFKVNNLTTGVNSKRMLDIFQKLGFNGDIRVVGHPLDPYVLEWRQEVYERIQKNSKTGNISLGVFAGWITPQSQKREILSVARELKNILSLDNISVKFLVGNHQDLEKKIREIFIDDELRKKVEIITADTVYELVEVSHRLLVKDIDVLFCRPSELVFYSLALGMPAILFPGVGPGERDMSALLQKYARIKAYSEMEGYLSIYLKDRQNLAKISSDLYESGYNFDGAKNIAALLN